MRRSWPACLPTRGRLVGTASTCGCQEQLGFIPWLLLYSGRQGWALPGGVACDVAERRRCPAADSGRLLGCSTRAAGGPWQLGQNEDKGKQGEPHGTLRQLGAALHRQAGRLAQAQRQRRLGHQPATVGRGGRGGMEHTGTQGCELQLRVGALEMASPH